MSELAAVDIADFQAGSKLMGEAYAIKSGDQFERAKQSIARYCYAKFNASEDYPETDEALQAQALAHTLVSVCCSMHSSCASIGRCL